MVTRHYVILYRDQDGVVIATAEADDEVRQLRQQIADLRELLDNTRRISLEVSKVLRGLDA